MRKIALIIGVFVLAAMTLGQKPAAYSDDWATIKLYYPGNTPVETLRLTIGRHRESDVGFWRENGCLIYKQDGKRVVFCGTFKIVTDDVK